MEKLLYGVSYYDEYMPYDRLEEDVRMMQEAGINIVRFGESTWSTYEPQNGVFDFTSIDRVLEAMHRSGISVIIGTPTYAVPTWMVKEHPGVLAVTRNGQNKYGARQIMDITNPAYLYFAERAIRRIIEHVHRHPAVIGFQADNETSHYGTCGPNVQTLFVKYMKDRFGGDLNRLNKEFGLDYWSNRINAWEDFPSVEGTINGSLGAEFDRFQRSQVTKFLNWQANIIREYKRPDQFVTHNFNFEWRGITFGINPDVDHFEASQAFDVAGIDVYHHTQDQLTGIEIAFNGDIGRSMKRDNYLVLETEAQGFANWLPYPGQLRLQAFSHLASGANMVAYWPWHSIHNSIETYWKGLLSHDFAPNPTYEEAKTIGLDFAKLSDKLFGLQKTNRVAILFSNEALTALQWFKLPGGKNYNDVLRQMYDSLFRMNVECDMIDPSSAEIEEYQLIIVPALYAASDSLLERLNRYVAGGGHIVYGFKSGFTNENVKVRWTTQPGIIGETCGVTYNQFTEGENVKLSGSLIDASVVDSSVTGWMELLTPVTADVLASYDHPYWGKYAAITRNSVEGGGEVTYIGCMISDSLMDLVLSEAVKTAGLWGTEQSLQTPLAVKTGVNQSGNTIRYIFNYSDIQQEFKYPFDSGYELLSDRRIDKGASVSVVPWGFFIIES